MAAGSGYWMKFLTESKKRAENEVAAQKKSDTWLMEQGKQGYLRVTPKAASLTEDYVFALFYTGIAGAVPDKRVVSPIAARTDSSWMIESDFCFLNVRAVGPEPEKPGNFIDAMKMLPFLRVNSIHLAPFFDCMFDNVYAIDSLEKINPELVHKGYEQAGISDEEQLKLLIDAIHILERTVGFDLEPHTSQFSRVVLINPQFFRWLEITPDRQGLAGGISQDEMMADAVQQKIHEKVRGIVNEHLKKASLAALDLPETSNEEVKRVQGGIISELIASGLWTLPSHTWGGVGLPEFTRYNMKHNYPMFEYLDEDGENQSDQAFGMLTPIKFAEGLNINTLPSEEEPSRPWEPGIDFFASIFPHVREKYGFDFVRLDYVDHVFDSVLEGTRDIPLADRPTPYVLERVISRARQDFPSLGAMAERMGYEFADYESVGFDLVLGADVIRVPDERFVADMLNFQDQITTFNRNSVHKAAIQYAVDSHDTGHPGINTNPVQFGRSGMLMRFFFARFGSCGCGRRSKYEVIGNQDMSLGLYQANNEPVSLNWADNQPFFRLYHNLEDMYDRLRPAIRASCIREKWIGKKFCIWYLDRWDGERSRLVCIVNPDMDKKTRAKSEELKIFPFYEYGFERAQVYRVDFAENSFVPVELNEEGEFSAGVLKPGDVQLYLIMEEGQPLPERG